MSVYNHRPMVPSAVSGRFNDLLEAVKNEYEALSQETSVFKLQRDEYEHKSSRFDLR